MPKLVDRDERRRRVVDAVFRLVVRDGVEGASLRHVAAEAGLNIGSVRHYFDSAEELLTAAAREMAERVERRVRSHEEAVDRAVVAEDPAAQRAAVLAMVEELLPLDDERRLETTVWLAFTERSRTTEALRPYAAELIEGSREVVRPMTQALGLPDEAAEAFAACVDGLVLAAVHDPDDYPPARQRRVLAYQLDLVVAAAGTRR